MKVIKFYATWCGPCKDYEETFQKIASANKDKHSFDSYDIDQHPLAVEWLKTLHKGKATIPTTVFISDDGSIDVAKGALSEGQIERRL